MLSDRPFSLLAMLLLCLAGCRIDDCIERKSISDLYQEAVDSAARRPEVIQACFPERNANRHTVGESSLSEEEIQPLKVFDRTPTVSQPELLPLDHIDDLDLGASSSRKPLPKSEHIPSIVVASYQTNSPNKISEIFEQTDIREAVQIMATTAGVDVVVDETVGGVTSAQIENESFEEALKKVLMPLGLVYAKVDGKFVIAPPEPDSPLFSYVSQRSQYSPRYHPITQLVDLLPPRFKTFLHPQSSATSLSWMRRMTFARIF